MNYVSDLDTPLLQLSPTDHFTLRDAVQGVHIFGGIGSGKTSGSGKHLASAYLRAGFGGLVMAAKPEEVEQWLRYAKENGRENSVILFGERGGGFNFITYELSRQGADGLGSVVECLMRILDTARHTNPNAGRGGEPFWEDAVRQVLRNTLPVLYSATGTVRIPDIIKFVASAPSSQEQIRNKEWQDSSFMFAMLAKARRAPVIAIGEDEFDKAGGYWRDEFGQLDNKLRSSIAMSLSTALDRFNRGRLYKAFCTETTLLPENTFYGALIILDMPALTWNEDGIIAQQLFKFFWQRSVLARNNRGLPPEHSARPIFSFSDENQLFNNQFDADFQSTCRSSKACTVCLSQSLPTYYAKMGGENPKAKADMLLGNFGTKIFHNNADPETNKWAADTIGRSLQRRANHSDGTNHGHSRGMSTGEGTNWGSTSSSGASSGAGGSSTSWSSGSSSGGSENKGRNRGSSSGESITNGYSETMDYEIEPADFSRYLRTGGAANGKEVTAIWFQAGKFFNASQRNYLVTRFQQ